MREATVTLNETKDRVKRLKGLLIKFKVNTGRNRIIEFTGKIENTFPAIFTVRANLPDGESVITYSYSDVLTKSVRFYPASVTLDP